MNFYTARDLRTIPKTIWNSLSEDGEVIITNNGKPTALMLNISEKDFDTVISSIRQARAMMAFNNMRAKAEKAGFMTDEEINAEIALARKECNL
jgi:hypothetical protein